MTGNVTGCSPRLPESDQSASSRTAKTAFCETIPICWPAVRRRSQTISDG